MVCLNRPSVLGSAEGLSHVSINLEDHLNMIHRMKIQKKLPKNPIYLLDSSGEQLGKVI